VKRRRSSAPGRLRPDGRWSNPILLVTLLAVLLAACGSSTGTDQPTTSAAPPIDGVPTETATTDPSAAGPTADPSVTEEPTASEPTERAATTAPADPSTGTGSAACSGSDENRDFFASMAAAVNWTVYCPVVPDGWFVRDGQYRLANGGWMDITYDGPGDAGISLRQGALGDAADGCFPPGPQVADAAFGDQTGVLVDVSTGGWAVVVDRGEPICWVIVVAGLDEAGARTIAADLHAVAG
jgi:hypothetical protein